MCVLALAGCGGDNADESKVREVATAYLKAIDTKDGSEACSHLTPALRKRFVHGYGTCPKGVVPIQRLGPGQKGKVDRVEVSGDRASVRAIVTAKGLGGSRERLELVRAGGSWKIRRLSSSALPGPN